MYSPHKMILGFALVCSLAGSQAIAAPPAAQQAATANPLTTWLKGAYNNGRNNIARAAEKMPEEFYGLRPGPQTEVRTFAQLVGHLANFNYLWCSDAKGEKNPNQGNDFEKLTAKADLVKGLNAALAYCDSVYSEMNDRAANEIITLTNDSGREVKLPRVGRLIQNHAHNNEHYGNMVTYMRIKSIVPPSSAPAAEAPAAPVIHAM